MVIDAGRQEDAYVTVQRRDAVATLTLNRPQKYNVLSTEMMDALESALAALAPDTDVRVIVIGACGKAFSAGHDLGEMGGDVDLAGFRVLFSRCTRLMRAIREQPQPVIASVRGVATAAGCQLAGMCDLVVASSAARFAASGINLGLFCATPAVALSRSMHPKHALEMLLTGEFVDAKTACERGLVNRVVGDEELDAAVRSLAETIAAKSAAAISAGKRLFYAQLDASLETAYELAVETMARNAIFDEAREGVDRFNRKR
jgi:enoyl-CoA hydratase/carnithine racemase